MSQLTTTGFNVEVNSFDEGCRVADLLSKSNIVPKSYQGMPNDCMVAMMLGSELSLNPIQALQNIAVINGRPSLWGDSMLALVQKHPAYEWHKEEVDDSDAANVKAVFTIKRKGAPEPHVEVFTQADAVAAGLWGRNTWKAYPKRMLQMRARGFGLRNQFSDALCGLISAEEAQDIPASEAPAQQSQPIEMGDVEIVKSELSDSDFQKGLPKWTQAIESKIRTAGEIIENVQEKKSVIFTQEQIDTLKAI